MSLWPAVRTVNAGARMRDHRPMRILFTTAPGVGHLLPLLPLAREARDRGHEVVIGGGASLTTITESAGFRHELMGPATIGEMFRGLPDLSSIPPRERVLISMPKVFCEGIAPAMADGVSALVERWRPDVIVHEDMEFGSWAVAEQAGIPHVTVQTTAWRPWIRDLATAALEPLGRRFGLADADRPAQILGRAFFTTRPASLRDPAMPLPEVTAELRPIADDRLAGDDGTADDPFPPRDGRPRVAITLGTVNNAQVALMRTLVEGADAAGAHVIVALGADPASLGAVPAGVDVRAYVPMSTLLPAADLVVYHGGSGTMLAALAAGTPMVIVPLAADQPDNGDRAEAAGLARVLSPEVNAATLSAAIESVVADPSYPHRASEIAAEVAAMPGPDVALDRIQSIAQSADTPSGSRR
jgi:UDP:flavonoid glycosyltransferase YjiC (YdhE family)